MLRFHSSLPRLVLTSLARTTFKARKTALLLFSVAVLLAGGAAAVRGQSALDGFDPNANGTIRVVVVQPDGKILIGGDFTTLSPNGGAAVTRNHIARLNPDGTLDTAFNPNANNVVFAIAVQADGKILAGGDFTQHRRTDAQSHRPARCHDRLGGFVRPERERCCLFNRGAGGRQDFSGRRFQRSEQHRRTDAQSHRPARCHDRLG